ncbi:DoxX family protein [Cellulomonas dongxiuzhuiae]|uniref:DoxX family protein n=1 Tax=Cellulomonas dongxiuzhuiae TaxID=2819979 RepID=UPI001AAFF42A|nr:DoxX family protein [Cellulomonas dongxiuzhuiae]MBO3089169.1 DoxX family protein [Cellulomonas dongxiuzhuiae]
MDVVLWIIAGVLAAVFVASGLMKLALPRARLTASGMAWAEDLDDGQVKAIGAAEVLGGLGLVLPAATGIVPVLTPIAAAGLAVVMVGATLTHVRRREGRAVPVTLVLLGLTVFLAVMRFGASAS